MGYAYLLYCVSVNPRTAVLAFRVCSVIAVVMPNICSYEFPVDCMVAEILPRLLPKSAVETAKFAATSFTASIMCSESDISKLNAFNCAIMKLAASPASSSSSATF